MIIAKRFRWEMGHRLLYHPGKCKNLHGHSYKALIRLEGDLNDSGIIMDFYDLKRIVWPLIEKLDHSFMINKADTEVLHLVERLKTKIVLVEFETTAENLCVYILKGIASSDLPKNIHSISCKINETNSTYAENRLEL